MLHSSGLELWLKCERVGTPCRGCSTVPPIDSPRSPADHGHRWFVHCQWLVLLCSSPSKTELTGVHGPVEALLLWKTSRTSAACHGVLDTDELLLWKASRTSAACDGILDTDADVVVHLREGGEHEKPGHRVDGVDGHITSMMRRGWAEKQR